MFRLHFAADALAFGEDAQSVFAENFFDAGVGVAAVEQRLRDFREMRDVFHADGHVGAVVIGAEADVIDAAYFYGVVNVVDDARPIDTRKRAIEHIFVDDFVFGHDLAGFVVFAALGIDFVLHALGDFGMGFVGVEIFLAEKADVIIDLDDASVRGEGFDHVVGHIARSGAERAAGRVRGDDGRFADGEGIVKSFVRGMRNVDHDAVAIHAQDDLLAKIGEAVVRGLVVRGVSPIGVDGVREGHVADAESGESVEDGEVVVDHVAAFNAHERGDFVFGEGAADVGGGAREHDVAGMGEDLLADGVDLVESFFDGGGASNCAGHPDGEENAVETAGFHARNVDLAVGVARVEIEMRIEEALGGVVMRVDDNGMKMEFAGALGDFDGLHGLRGHDQWESHEQNTACGASEMAHGRSILRRKRVAQGWDGGKG
jgi:hypothetical protein